MAASATRLGATPHGQETGFVVWAPHCERVTIDVVSPAKESIALARGENGYFCGRARVRAGARYFVRPGDGDPRPDPASRYQPDGVHGPSEVVDPAFEWHDEAWRGIPLTDYIIYELHIGTFTRAGTFDAAIERIDELKQLGITAIEIMPVAQFPGARNWGYDGVLPYAVQNSYGGPAAMKRFVDAAHRAGIAVVLDVVYNHIGPEGNYLHEFAPYFTDTYRTPWGAAMNVDGEHSDGVRRYFIDNALEWVTDYHVDALRLDAVHGILDMSARPFLAELTDAVHERAHQLQRPLFLIAESDLNDVRMIRGTDDGGMGMDAQWTDDFHHSLHALLTREAIGYYTDFGDVHHLATSLRRGFVYAGDYSAYRKRRHGNQPDGASPEQFVVCIQNHDQIGNRMLGDRLSALVTEDKLRLAAACVLFSPFVPLLFMGDEYGETRPFPYFVDHSDEQLVHSVREGRRQEFASFAWAGEPPDPAARDTFAAAVVEPVHNEMLDYYRTLIRLRKDYDLGPVRKDRDVIELHEHETIVLLQLGVAIVLCFASEARSVPVPLPRGEWREVFSSRRAEPADAVIASPGSVRLELQPFSALLFAALDEAA